MDNQQIKDEIKEIKSEPSDNYDEQTNTTVETITMLHEVKPDLETISETNPGIDKNTQLYNRLNDEVYQALKREVDCEGSDLYNLHEQTNTTTAQITEYHKDEPDAQIFICDHCDGQFTAKSSLEQHIISDHNSAASDIVIVDCISLKCTKCNFTGTSSKHIEQHAKLHDKKIFVCSTCGHECGSRRALSRHRRSTHLKRDRSFNCDHSDYKTADRGNLKDHVGTHTGEKPYKCSYCDFKCKSKYNLTQHIKKHTGEKPYKCSYCDYKATKSSNLKRHLMTHTEENPYKCSYCDYKCKSNSHLKIHIRIHTGEKPYKCSYCDYKCKSNSNLKEHIKIHTGEKPYKCSYCDYKSTKSSHLKVHVRTHTREKPYKCSSCDYKCKSKFNLSKHIKKHTGEKPYK